MSEESPSQLMEEDKTTSAVAAVSEEHPNKSSSPSQAKVERDPADQEQGKDEAVDTSVSLQGGDDADEGSEEGEASEIAPEDEMQAQLAKHRWYKLNTDSLAYDLSVYPAHYFLHADTHESIWTEPTEPYWLWDYETAGPDIKAGLQFPKPDLEAGQASAAKQPPDDYQGYNPKIHGNYDPNAPYAQYHKQLHATDQSQVSSTMPINSTDAYASTMPLNRYTGQVQANPNLSTDRHSDAAKSQRQLNAFFDADAAANMHGGKSLKEDRRNQKLSGEEIKAFNKARRERKEKKRKAFLMS